MALTTDAGYGQHNSDNYVLGRGTLRADLYDSANVKTGRFLDLGNCTNFVVNSSEETLEHESSRSGLKTTDASVTLKKTFSGSFTLDEITPDNLAMFLSGTVAESSVAGTTLSSVALTFGILADVAEIPGKWYEIKKAGTRVYNLTGVVIKNTGGTVTYVLDTDYKLDTTLGLIFVVVGGAIDTNNDLAIEVDATVTAATMQDIQMLQNTVVRAALLFAGENATTGEKFEARLHSCKISADGDAAFIGDEFLTMNFNFVIESVTDSAFAASPFMTVRKVLV